MAIQLTEDQERRIQVVIKLGAYESVDDVVDAALAGVEQRVMSDFDGADGELGSLLSSGLASSELDETEFWNSVNSRTDALLAEHKVGLRS